jgi:membrane-anchored protein YejM (alkaline phosphatase superfamily)
MSDFVNEINCAVEKSLGNLLKWHGPRIHLGIEFMRMFTKREKTQNRALIFSIVVLFLSGVLSTESCRLKRKDAPLNVILITLDTQRADYISAFCSTNVETPHIDSFAQKGIFFTNCYSPIPITVPAHGSLFYSILPHELDLYNNGQIFTNENKLASLAQIFKEKGYQTAGFVSLGVLGSQFQLSDGYDTYIDRHPETRWYLHAEEVNERVFPWLDKKRENPFFIWIHYSDPHDPYAPPSLPPDLQVYFNDQLMTEFCLQKEERLSMEFELRKGVNTIEYIVLNPYPDSRDEFRMSLNDIKYNASKDINIKYEGFNVVEKDDQLGLLIKERGRIRIENSGDHKELKMRASGRLYLLTEEKIQAYREEVEYMDREIGRLIAKLEHHKLIDNTMVVIVGDHGEGLGDHRTLLGDPHFGHIHYLYNEYLKVPLIFYNPHRKERGTERADLVTILDVAPTILASMGWKKMPFYRGFNLQKIQGERNPVIFGETFKPESTRDRFSGLQSPWHLIFTPSRNRYELYNLTDDPTEQTNIFDKKHNDPYILDLQKTVKSFTLKILSQKKDIEIDPKSLEMLKSLGYIK